jgi:DNA-binding NarL/FixJ family response regulator
MDILALLAAGGGNVAIAETRPFSVRTVGRHIGNIHVRIAAQNRAQATAYTSATASCHLCD